jgi:aspartate kinase
MSLIVQKFGGTSVSDAKGIVTAAKKIIQAYIQGYDVIAVVSAQGHTTDNLIEKAAEINSNASKREMDVLLSSGEQVSIALLTMAVENLGYPAVSLLGWQAGINTCKNYGFARIESIDTIRIKNELAKKNIVIVAGFQGINEFGDVTTIGRGGSDTSAVTLAAVMGAKICRMYTDVDGIYTSDPKIVKNAHKLDVIDYDEMLELSSLGAQVLNNRSVEAAKKYNVEIEVLSSMKDVPGTIVKKASNPEKRVVTGVVADRGISIITLANISGAESTCKFFPALADAGIDIDVILKSYCEKGTDEGKSSHKDISFTVSEDCLEKAVSVLKEHMSMDKNSKIFYSRDVAKISIVGADMEAHVGIAAKMFKALHEANIGIQMTSTGEIKVCVIIDIKDTDLALNSIHDKFFGASAK